jgi:hypothetical protein
MKKGICDVCFYVDNDATIKDVEYCETCNAYICDKCKYNLFRRGLAMIKRQTSKILILLLMIITFASCKKEDIKEIQPTEPTVKPTVQPTPKQYYIVIENTFTMSYSFKINDKEITTNTAIAYTGDKIHVLNNGDDTYSPSPGGNVVKNEGMINIKVFINNELTKEANCNCDFELIKILE